jgi:phage-related protein
MAVCSRSPCDIATTPFALYAVKIDADIWVIHAFQKKSKSGIKTPQMEVDLVRDRLKRLKEALR